MNETKPRQGLKHNTHQCVYYFYKLFDYLDKKKTDFSSACFIVQYKNGPNYKKKTSVVLSYQIFEELTSKSSCTND